MQKSVCWINNYFDCLLLTRLRKRETLSFQNRETLSVRVECLPTVVCRISELSCVSTSLSLLSAVPPAMLQVALARRNASSKRILTSVVVLMTDYDFPSSFRQIQSTRAEQLKCVYFRYYCSTKHAAYHIQTTSAPRGVGSTPTCWTHTHVISLLTKSESV